jgi:FKBP-type peptidyl-prolyl cis-trans isomerase
MQSVKKIIIAAGVVLIAAGCNQVDFKKTKGGMPYKLFASKSGKKIENGKFVKMHITTKIKDSVMFNTYKSLPVYFQINTAAEKPYDPSEVFTLMKEGDSIYAVQMLDTFIKKDPTILQQTKYKNGDKMITTFKLLNVFNTPEEAKADEDKEKAVIVKREETVVKDFISKKGITTQRAPLGTHVEILQPGTGAQVDSGKYVSVMYRGQTFAGKVFDTNMDASFKHTEPLSFQVGAGQMIRGLDEGIRLLKEGGRGRIYIPSTLAYGAQPPSPDIKPFENLIFDVQVVSVSDQAPPPPPMPPGMDPSQQQQMPK